MISIIYPTRSRPVKAWENANKWIDSAGYDTEIIISLDMDDPEIKEYLTLFKEKINPDSKWHIILNNNKNLVEATNVAALKARGGIIIFVSDDFLPFDKWGDTLIKLNYREEFLIKVNDGYQKFEVPMLTIPIMSKKLYKSLGYFFHPAYKSQFCDTDLYYVTMRKNVIKYHPEIIFKHNHPAANPEVPWDETYERSSAGWRHDEGKRIFEKRLLNKFE